MDVRFKNDASFLLAGPSSSGKTTFVTNLVKEADKLFVNKPNNIYWCSSYPVLLDQQVPGVTYDVGIPADFITRLQKDDILILDDLMIELSNQKEVTELFTRGTHHIGFTLIYITQNMFDRTNASSRTRSINATYVVLFRNVRDCTQINSLAYQIYGTKSKFLVNAYQNITADNPYSYLLIDFRQDVPEFMRARSNILPHEHPYTIYVQRDRHAALINKQVEKQMMV